MRKLPILLLLLMVLPVWKASAWDVDEKYTGPKTPTTDLSWHPDVLDGYEARYVNQGTAFDGPVRSTIVRLLNNPKTKKGILYIHGFNDYFFQSEMGKIYADSGYAFYAVDLRRYGRSKEPWQWPYNVRNLDEYFEDIDSAIVQMHADGITDITLTGHSTGGLTTALYCAVRGKNCPVQRLVTDSPFLEWNFNTFFRNCLIPTVSFLGGIFPNAKRDQGHCDGYAYSLLKEYHGQWTYNTDWKMIYSPPVTYSWVRAIERGQGKLMKKAKNISIPVLVMHSSRKISGCCWTPEFQTGDAVLDPAMIQKRGEKLGSNPMVCTIDSGLHDLILSEPVPRQAAYDTIFHFLRLTDTE